MIRRSCRICLEVVAGLAALLAVVAGVGVWRLSQGPVNLDGLTPRLEHALTAARPDTRVTVGGTALAWRGWPETFALRLREVRVAREGEPLARLPELDMQLSMSALARGTLAPTSVTARGATLTLVRGKDGFRLGGDGGERDASALLARLLDDLMAAPTPDNRLSYLNAVTIADAAMHVRDERLGLAWRAPEARLSLRRTASGLSGDAEVTAAVGDARVRLDGDLAYTAGDDAVAVRVGATGLHPDALVKAIPQLSLPGELTVPLDASVRTRVGLDGHIGDLAARLDGGSGTLRWPGRYDEPLPIRELTLAANYDRGGDRLTVDTLALTLGTADSPGPRIAGEATVANVLSGAITVETAVKARNVRMARLGRYWPKGASTNTRQWITGNVPTGRIDRAEITTTLRFPDRFAGGPKVRDMDGRLRFRGAEVHYMRPLPPVTGVSGRATLDETSLSVSATGGELGPIRVPNGEIAITGLEGTDHRIAIDLDVNGPLRHALTVLNHPRLGLIDELGLRPEAASGRARGQVHFAFPLLDDLRMEQLEARAEAKLTDVGVRDFLLGKNATRGDLDLKVTTERMELSGPIELADVPLTFAWTETFAADDGVVSEMRAQVPEVTAAARRRLGVATAPYLTGPVGGTVVSRTHADGARVLDAAVTLDRAELALKPLHWRKPAGTPGSAATTVRLREGHPPSVEAFSVSAGGGEVPPLKTTGSAAFAPGGAFERATLDHLTLGETALDDIEVRDHGERWSVRVGGGTLDARPWLADAAGVPDGAGSGAADGGPPLTVAVAPLDRVIVGDGRQLTDVAVNARRDASGAWRALRLNAGVPDRFARDGRAAGGIAGHYRPEPEGPQTARLTVDNLGATLRALDVADRLRGGKLTFDGQGRAADPDSPVDGELIVTDLVVKEVPALARLLTLASLTGLADMLGGKGVTFQRVSGDLTYADGTLATQLVHAYGPSLGLTTKGKLRVDGWNADLDGTVVPAARVNRLLGKIPLLGDIITGGEGQGVIAMRYTLRGPLADPEIRVNPLSALTPGFLRGVFGLFDRDPAPGDDWPKAVPEREPEGGPASK
ncbi:AsmA-like C-terminal region [Limimonas halophila]|uniref:AsmA-like C-terminal region n=1 Tax=Limimonas halophila TaxID=1082479 RepID=A0A1G7KX74_9PROT|nr:AsmA-like C-terminal domain-containing protein [Limimonas halophila]SDF41793.1 AsmA-like C-terminal region [Limimonas halophila]